MSFYDYTVPVPDGTEMSMEQFRGKVVLVVNTATGCGFTPQYRDLEALYEKYHDKGLEILDIPCNQFKEQAPGTDEEIHEFCTLHYNTQFPQMKKSLVNGVGELPLFTFLKAEKGFEGFGKGPMAVMLGMLTHKIGRDDPAIRWNFTKFAVDREGNVRARFEPTTDMKAVEDLVAALLDERTDEQNA